MSALPSFTHASPRERERESRSHVATIPNSLVPSVLLTRPRVRVHGHRGLIPFWGRMSDRRRTLGERASKRVARGLEGDGNPHPLPPAVGIRHSAEPWSLVRPVYPVTPRYAYTHSSLVSFFVFLKISPLLLPLPLAVSTVVSLPSAREREREEIRDKFEITGSKKKEKKKQNDIGLLFLERERERKRERERERERERAESETRWSRGQRDRVHAFPLGPQPDSTHCHSDEFEIFVGNIPVSSGCSSWMLLNTKWSTRERDLWSETVYFFMNKFTWKRGRIVEPRRRSIFTFFSPPLSLSSDYSYTEFELNDWRAARSGRCRGNLGSRGENGDNVTRDLRGDRRRSPQRRAEKLSFTGGAGKPTDRCCQSLERSVSRRARERGSDKARRPFSRSCFWRPHVRRRGRRRFPTRTVTRDLRPRFTRRWWSPVQQPWKRWILSPRRRRSAWLFSTRSFSRRTRSRDVRFLDAVMLLYIFAMCLIKMIWEKVVRRFNSEKILEDYLASLILPRSIRLWTKNCLVSKRGMFEKFGRDWITRREFETVWKWETARKKVRREESFFAFPRV